MKHLLLALTVLLSTSLSALEEVWQYSLPPSSSIFYVGAVGNDGSAALISFSSDEILWIDSSGQLIKSIVEFSLAGENAQSVSDNHLIVKSDNDGIYFYKPNENPEILSHPGNNGHINASESNPNFSCYRKDNSTFVMMQISDGTTSASISTIPSNAVVIPSDSSGPVQIILESSEDMVNWNSANPGTYGASTNERFFRIRAVQDTE